jgi:glycosyltransferase 2 family protein
MTSFPRTAISRRFIWWVKVIFLLLVGGVIITQISSDDVVRVLQSLESKWIIPLILLSFLMVGVSVAKWQLFLRHFLVREPFTRLYRLYLFGYFINLIMPSAAGGDIARSLSLSCEKKVSLAATFFERYTGLLSMLLLALIAALFSHTLPPTLLLGIAGMGFLLTALIGFLFLPSSLFRFLERVLPSRISKALVRGHLLLREVHRTPSLMIKSLLWSFLFHTLTIVNTLLGAYAIGWHETSFMDLALVVPLILIVGAIPISPQGLGIQEGAFVFFLAPLGATPAQALALVLLLRVKTYLLALCGGVEVVMRGRSRKF